MKLKGNILGIAELIAALVLIIGALTFFSACESENGMHMACHWAQNAVALSGVVIALLSAVRVFIPNRDIKTGLMLGIFITAVSVIFIPNTVISLCMMDTMRCHTIFKPAVIITASVIAVISGVDTVVGFLRQGKEK